MLIIEGGMMKFCSIVVFLMIAFNLKAGDIVGLPTEIKGDVSYRSNEGEWKALVLNMPLYQGDSIFIGDSSSVGILYSNGHFQMLDEPQKLQILTPLQEQSISETMQKLWNSLIANLKEAYSEERLADYAGIRGEDIVITPGRIISPLGTKIARKNPKFIWTYDKSISRSEVILRDEDKELWKMGGVTPGIELSEKDSPITAGTEYVWVLKSDIAMGVELTDTAEFEMLDSENLQRLSSLLDAKLEHLSRYTEGASAYLIRAQTYENEGLYADALESYLEYVEKSDNDPHSVAVLANYYYERGFPELAIKSLLSIVDIPEELRSRW